VIDENPNRNSALGDKVFTQATHESAPKAQLEPWFERRRTWGRTPGPTRG